MRHTRRLARIFVTVSCAWACHPSANGVDRAYMDTTCAPCQAFYKYANGRWIASARATVGQAPLGAHEELRRRSADMVRSILDSLADERAPAPSLDMKVGRFYATCTDTTRANREGAKPLHDELDRIDQIASVADLETEVARLNRIQIGVLFNFTSIADPKRSDRMIGDLSPGGTGLLAAEYYTQANASTGRIREAYRLMLDSLFQFANTNESRQGLAVDSALAVHTSSGMTLHVDPGANYHKLTIPELDSLTPHWSWTQYFAGLGVGIQQPRMTHVLVEQPQFFRSLDQLLSTVPLQVWRSYLREQYIQSAAPWLDSRFRRVYGRTALIVGIAFPDAPWRRCVAKTNELLGNAVGEAYVRRAFTPGAKQRILAMARNIEAILQDDLDTLSWMSAPTRRAASAKLRHFVVKIGYPDRWPDYTRLTVRDTSFWQNVVFASEFATDRAMATLERAVDRRDMQYTPQTVDGYFNPSANEVGLAAGILQPPLFDSLADDASNYGATGVLIAHELTHAFDEQGRQYDSTGNLHDWWAPADDSAFRQRAALLVRQYNGYVVVDSLHINGSQTLSENLADVGGLVLAYRALERRLHDRPRRTIDGFTPEQRFFLAYAQSRRGLFSGSFLRNQVLTDNHAPYEWRVLGAIADMPAFASAFHCKAGDPLVLPDSLRVRIW